jgi:hypothetical protein
MKYSVYPLPLTKPTPAAPLHALARSLAFLAIPTSEPCPLLVLGVRQARAGEGLGGAPEALHAGQRAARPDAGDFLDSAAAAGRRRRASSRAEQTNNRGTVSEPWRVWLA